MVAWILSAALLGVLAGCMSDSVFDEITTELTVFNPGAPGGEIEIRKRFRFTHDPMDARGVFFREAYIQVLVPTDSSLDWIGQIDVYVIEPGDADNPDGVPTLVATGSGFGPDARVADLEIVHVGDLRPFAGDDARVMFSFVIRPTVWGRPFPEGGVTVSSTAVIEIDI
jgi:hypothetical protein